MLKHKRRRLIKLAGSAAAVASTGMAGILASGRAPAYAQQQTVQWLRWIDFLPGSDQLLRDELLPQAEQALGIKITLETVNGSELPARTAEAVQSGSGPDLIMAFNSTAQLYANSVVDLTDLAENLAKREGGFFKYCRSFCADGRRFISMPWCVIGTAVAYRERWFAEAGSPDAFPRNWDQYRAVGRALKSAGHPIGQALGHAPVDAPIFTYPYFWSWGGKEVEADGRTVAINSRETIESVKFMQALWTDAFDQSALAWDDASNNRAFLSGALSATLTSGAIYLEALRRPNVYRSGHYQMADDIRHAPLPAGPAGQFDMPPMQSTMLMRYSTNQDAAKALLKWIHSELHYEKWFVSQKGYATPCTPKWEDHALWAKEARTASFRLSARLGSTPGYAGPVNQKAAEAVGKYIITDMYTKAVQGMSAEEAVTWADGELRKIYEA